MELGTSHRVKNHTPHKTCHALAYVPHTENIEVLILHVGEGAIDLLVRLLLIGVHLSLHDILERSQGAIEGNAVQCEAPQGTLYAGRKENGLVRIDYEILTSRTAEQTASCKSRSLGTRVPVTGVHHPLHVNR